MKLNRTNFPSEMIWRLNKTSVSYFPAKRKKYQTPILFIYSIINKPSILNLTPDSSVIKSFTNQGYDVYLLDFGSPGIEDKNIGLNEYILYIHKAVKRIVHHSGSHRISLFGYCLGGTFAAIYTSLYPTHIKNLILFAAPIDFETLPFLNSWKKEWLHEKKHLLQSLKNEYGIIPASFVKHGMKWLISPFSITPKLAVLSDLSNEDSVNRWISFNQWLNDHIPMSGKVFQEFMNDLVTENKLVKNKLIIHGKRVSLKNIRCPMLVITTENDTLVPKEMTFPIMKKVSSMDKKFLSIKGGHISIALRTNKPLDIFQWIEKRS